MSFATARADSPGSEGARAVAIATLIALSFLFPFAGGPSVSVWQELATWACVALLLILAPCARPAWPAVLWLCAVAAAILLGRSVHPHFALSAAVAVAATGLAACVGAGLAQASPARKSALAWGILAAGLLSAVLGLLQYYGLAEALVPWTSAPDLGQAYGNLRQRNQFATLVSMGLVALLWVHAMRPVRMRPWLLASSLLLVAAAAASTSRTGLLQWLLICGVAAFLARRERRRSGPQGAAPRLPHPLLLLTLIPLYAVAAWVVPRLAGSQIENMLHRLREGAPDAHSRLVLWGNVLELIGQHPWSGWGWGELKFAHYSTIFEGPRYAAILDNAHNLPLHLAVELGVPAAVLICVGFGWLVFAARPWREGNPSRLMAWALLGAIVLHSLLEYPLWYGPFQLAFGLCLGFLWPAPRRQEGPGRIGMALSGGAALALLAVTSYAAWDYTRISQLYLAREDRLPAYRDDAQSQARRSWLFAAPVQFAILTTTQVTPANASEMHALAQRILHFSPEPRVIVRLIESATLLGLHDEAAAQAARFRLAFPDEYARWLDGRSIDDPSE